MNKTPKALTHDQLADLSWEMQKIVSQCNTIGEAMKLWVSSMSAFVEFHVSDKPRRGEIMDACIKQLRKFKKQMQK